MLDIEPAARRMTRLFDAVTDDRLADPTPCVDYTLGDLLAHVSALSVAFAAAAAKSTGPEASAPPAPDAAHLGGDWRSRVPAELTDLVAAWQAPGAWEGMTRVGGLDLPGEVAGRVVLTELVIHGWDVARATDRPYDGDPTSLEESITFVAEMAAADNGSESPFGPPVAVADDAPLLDRLIGLSGRDPHWSAPRHASARDAR
ncbi:TIGR03086 family protein [Haloechinothrix sp. YIM 98757]|uniref:TIGR03086 family protein n=1 Tax=Haloechinothrix aidingensis TaxID=2752311 RepID=A0A838A8Z1_9PSEU|nr:TIGR03086 family metal-binding protein [Haloechinothrix aidingensis]MBA0126005.1 TIGR03086 family protein [Haloechinothrix aidingensis]